MASGFKVIIAGGGIAGLTLANALEVCASHDTMNLGADDAHQKGNIDYVLLERRKHIAPQVGASIGILPNGCRVC